MSTEDSRNVIELSRYLDSQEVSGEEETAQKNAEDAALAHLVDDHLTISHDREEGEPVQPSDELIDAFISCHHEFANMIRTFPTPTTLNGMTRADILSDVEHSMHNVEVWIEALSDKLKVSLRPEAEEAVR